VNALLPKPYAVENAIRERHVGFRLRGPHENFQPPAFDAHRVSGAAVLRICLMDTAQPLDPADLHRMRVAQRVPAIAPQLMSQAVIIDQHIDLIFGGCAGIGFDRRGAADGDVLDATLAMRIDAAVRGIGKTKCVAIVAIGLPARIYRACALTAGLGSSRRRRRSGTE
jgi:hypothetical protein